VPCPCQVLGRTHALKGAVKIFYDCVGYLGQLLHQRGATTLERLERGGFIVRGTILPTPLKDAEPLKGAGPYGRLVRLALVALGEPWSRRSWWQEERHRSTWEAPHVPARGKRRCPERTHIPDMSGRSSMGQPPCGLPKLLLLTENGLALSKRVFVMSPRI